MAEPSGCPFFRLRGIPGRCIIQAPDSAPEGTCSGFSFAEAETPLINFSLVIRSLKERFRFHRPAETPRTFGPFAQAPALLMRRPGGLTEPDRVTAK
jgi:hypothetical protein